MVQQVAVAASDADLDDSTNQLVQRLALSPDPVYESGAVPDLLISVLRLQWCRRSRNSPGLCSGNSPGGGSWLMFYLMASFEGLSGWLAPGRLVGR